MPYIPSKNWEEGDKVLSDNLNHIEEGLVHATEEAEKKELPSSGTSGQVLTKTVSGVAWKNIEIPRYESGTGITIVDKTISVDTSTIATTEELRKKQDTLVSGVNIKTINNKNIVGPGNLELDASKIDIIKVDDVVQYIDPLDKSVNIELAPRFNKKVDKVAGKDLSTNDFTDELKNKLDNIEAGAEVNVQSDFAESDPTKDTFIKNKPTKLSQFENDGDTASPFATQEYVRLEGGKIDKIKVNGIEQVIVEKTVDLAVPTKVSQLDNDANYINNIELQEAIAVESTARETADTTLQANITAEANDRNTADIALNTRIDNLESLGRYLSTWNCITGKPETDPLVLPYTYKTGDYYIISKIGETNYKPDGKEYTGVASLVIDTSGVKANDFYIFDGTSWKLLEQTQRPVPFGQLVGDPRDNEKLAAELDAKITLLGNEAISGEPYHFTYYYDIKPEADKYIIEISTITLDNTKNLIKYTKEIPVAGNGLAGLMSSEDSEWLRVEIPAAFESIANEFSHIGQIVSAEITARQDADAQLQNNIDTLATSLATEITARTDADIQLQNNINAKQDILISGTNIKTINSESILGSGNIEIQGATNYDELENRPIENQDLDTADFIPEADAYYRHIGISEVVGDKFNTTDSYNKIYFNITKVLAEPSEDTNFATFSSDGNEQSIQYILEDRLLCFAGFDIYDYATNTWNSENLTDGCLDFSRLRFSFNFVTCTPGWNGSIIASSSFKASSKYETNRLYKCAAIEGWQEEAFKAGDVVNHIYCNTSVTPTKEDFVLSIAEEKLESKYISWADGEDTKSLVALLDATEDSYIFSICWNNIEDKILYAYSPSAEPSEIGLTAWGWQLDQIEALNIQLATTQITVTEVANSAKFTPFISSTDTAPIYSKIVDILDLDILKYKAANANKILCTNGLADKVSWTSIEAGEGISINNPGIVGSGIKVGDTVTYIDFDTSIMPTFDDIKAMVTDSPCSYFDIALAAPVVSLNSSTGSGLDSILTWVYIEIGDYKSAGLIWTVPNLERYPFLEIYYIDDEVGFWNNEYIEALKSRFYQDMFPGIVTATSPSEYFIGDCSPYNQKLWENIIKITTTSTNNSISGEEQTETGFKIALDKDYMASFKSEIVTPINEALNKKQDQLYFGANLEKTEDNIVNYAGPVLSTKPIWLEK